MDLTREDMGEGEFGYVSLEECIESGAHLESCDDDGFCNSCGYQEENEFDDELNSLIGD